jgi:hypothetical protein
MFRAIVAGLVLAIGMFDGSLIPAAMHDDACRMAATEAGPARRGLLRRRALRASRNGRLAQGFPSNAAQEAPSAAVLEAQPLAQPLLPRQETEVWPQAAALFPAEERAP